MAIDSLFESKKICDEIHQNPISYEKSIGPSTRKKKVIILAGPTAVGKSHIALKIAKVIGGEVVSADSMQVYRGMDIGTAKISLAERSEVRHHLIDSRDLDEIYNVVEFYQDANQSLSEIFSRDRVPLVAGGTGFYIHSLLYGPPQGPASIPAIRAQIESEIEKKGSLALYEHLKSFDPEYALKITPNDRHKIVRGLEIITLTRQKVSDFDTIQTLTDRYDFRCWFLYMPKEILYARIDQRCETMIDQGFLDEIKRLKEEGIHLNSSAAQAIGYRQGLDYLSSAQTSQDREKFLASFKQASRRYAKRQFTWFRKEPQFRWLNVDSHGINHAIELIMQDYEQF